MNNKLVRNLASASVAAAIAVAMGSQVLAVEWYPSRTQSEVGVTQPSVSTSTGTSITVSSKPSIDPATGSAVQVESSQDVII